MKDIQYSIALLELLISALSKAIVEGNQKEITANYINLHMFLRKLYSAKETEILIDCVYDKCYKGYVMKKGKWEKVCEDII